ncbi:hypothetical protein [Nocardioides sp.]|uniref:hypothetical protein n=1 Tax=Nocardioides sp. TaxID=35761 RepID=UPI00199BF272|nr:hypothetical protein [Nocardioides sp.]MBC7275464.1 hypothetical protein [Nocardioides sp.]
MSDSAPSGDHRSDLQESRRSGIDWLATTAGALAAVTSALLLSTLGAVGTLAGAAVGSIAATIGTNLYSQGLAKSREKVARAQALARWRSAGLAGARGRSKPTPESVSESIAAAAPDESSDTEVGSGWRERLRALPWKRIGLASLAMFVVVVAAITIVELVAGRSVSSIVGGEDKRTTISGVTGGGSNERDRKPRQDPAPGETATSEPSSTPSTEPSQAPQQSEPAVPVEPSAPASETPSAEPTEQPGTGESGSSEAPPPGADQPSP